MGNEHGEREIEKWRQNFTCNLALSVTSFPILYFVPIFILLFPLLVPRFSNIQQTECIIGHSEIGIFTAIEVKSIK